MEEILVGKRDLEKRIRQLEDLEESVEQTKQQNDDAVSQLNFCFHLISAFFSHVYYILFN